MLRHPFRMLCLFAAPAMLVLAVSCGGKKPVQVPPPPPPVSTPAPVVNTPPPPPPPPPVRPTPTPTPAPPTAADLFAKMTLTELNNSHALADVFFDYDKAELSDKARASLQKNADWMRVSYQMNTTVMIEGHADSRGTNEYNLALGERRASAVRDYMVSLGIPVARITIVSKGEEQPVCTEEAESCWSQNRRGHFIFTAK